ncbi:LysR family transcriptional regulator [Hyphomonas sp.]|uniref:LysR family transcriptional regulator n=1 Tax=Hyphomonas sp. TaxID=87 RepID=UPI0025C29F75|nr:LysR family transcriptional regulator [Hyphomonas sp.]MBI1401374.1 LysR family transcriptional regulator [Hyphomonas sp.]
MDLNALSIFARVAETLSFSEAARGLGMPISTVSRKIASLENDLGVRLLERSTRHLRLTEIGADVLREAQRTADVGDAVSEMVSNRLTEVKGRISLSSPPSISDGLLAPLLSAFQAANAGVTVHVMVTDRFVDHISEGIDLALRVGDLKSSSLVARSLLTYRRRLVASPDYLARVKAPKHPKDLRDHRLLAFGNVASQHRWTFRRGGESTSVTFQPVLAMNDYAGLAAAVVAGAGIGDLPPIVRPDLLASGKLVEVMPNWKLGTETLSMVHLGGRQIARPLRTFIDFAIAQVPLLFPVLPK